MRYIDLEPLLARRDAWGASDELWKNPVLKRDFSTYFHNKCWYTEVDLTGSDVDIDHFRPKAAIKQYENYHYNSVLEHGYDWLKNDVHNYRASCIYANRPRGEGGKREWFPLKNDSPLLTPNGCGVELPLLLDPCVMNDVQLISFMCNDIGCTSSDSYDQEKVKVSSKIYNLLHTNIKIKRIKVWNEVEKTLEEFESNDISKGACVRRLSEMVSRSAEFSACAISAVRCLAPDCIKSKLDLQL